MGFAVLGRVGRFVLGTRIARACPYHPIAILHRTHAPHTHPSSYGSVAGRTESGDKKERTQPETTGKEQQNNRKGRLSVFFVSNRELTLHKQNADAAHERKENHVTDHLSSYDTSTSVRVCAVDFSERCALRSSTLVQLAARAAERKL